MIRKITFQYILVFVLGAFLTTGCNPHNGNLSETDREPVIEPDYSGVTIPQNIAPLNFKIEEEGKLFRLEVSSSNGYRISIKSRDGIIRFPQKSWRKLLSGNKEAKITMDIVSEDNDGAGKRFNPINLFVVNDSITLPLVLSVISITASTGFFVS